MIGPTGHPMDPDVDPIQLNISLFTPQNLSNYWHAMSTCSDDVFERLWNKCYIIEHREETVPPHAPIVRMKDSMLRNGRDYAAPTTMCKQVPCRRCDEGRGGFRFPWCGYWTTDRCIPDRGLFEAEWQAAARLAVSSSARSPGSSDEEEVSASLRGAGRAQ